MGRPAGPPQATLHTECGRIVEVDVGRWHAGVDTADDTVLDRVVGPVLDVGCGPGRMSSALTTRGIRSLGIDLSQAAVVAARAAGADAVVADVLSRVPGEGTWRTGLLLDGNVGIGADPVRLLRRLADVLAPDGLLLIEAGSHARPVRGRRVRVCHDGAWSAWFPWALVTAAELRRAASVSGWAVTHAWAVAGRSFLHLERRGAARWS